PVYSRPPFLAIDAVAPTIQEYGTEEQKQEYRSATPRQRTLGPGAAAAARGLDGGSGPGASRVVPLDGARPTHGFDFRGSVPDGLHRE
ncbi:MAG: hypothetical protein D6760_12075, partial [Deltaproteobacteria bacterium]